MNDYAFLNSRQRNRTLLIVEGEREEVKLFKTIFACFPEVQIDTENLIVFYGTNIYKLYHDIVGYYDDDWYDTDIDLPQLVTQKKAQSGDPNQEILHKRDFTNILLVFDYERHDPFFSEDIINKLQMYFNDETDQGKLYLNYPMVESYCDASIFSDTSYEDKKISVSMRSGVDYKQATTHSREFTLLDLPHKLFNELKQTYHLEDEEVSKKCVHEILSLMVVDTLPADIELIMRGLLDAQGTHQAKFHFSKLLKGLIPRGSSYYKFTRSILHKIIICNLCKANKLQNGSYLLGCAELYEYCRNLDFYNILQAQNDASRNSLTGYIWVLNTGVLFIPEYNPLLIEENSEIFPAPNKVYRLS